VRFRTPVKEPEELVYLFVALAIGIGLGAGHWALTVIAILLILALLTFQRLIRRKKAQQNLYLNIELQDGSCGDETLRAVVDLLSQQVAHVDLRRVDFVDGRLHATLYIECSSVERLLRIQKDLRGNFPSAVLTFVDQSSIPGG
jgi:uncharacterized membrane protein YhiD involved in acid resistance